MPPPRLWPEEWGLAGFEALSDGVRAGEARSAYATMLWTGQWRLQANGRGCAQRGRARTIGGTNGAAEGDKPGGLLAMRGNQQ